MKKRLFSGILVGIVMLSLTFNFAIAFQKSNAINDINSYNNVEKFDDKSCLIHCGDAFSKKDLLMTKEANLDKFDYKFFDNNTKDEIYNLSSTKNINFNDGKVSSIYNNYMIVWAAVDALKNGDDVGKSITRTVGFTLSSPLISAILKSLDGLSLAGLAGKAAFDAVSAAITGSCGWVIGTVGVIGLA